MTETTENIAEYGPYMRVTDESILEEIRSIDEDSFNLSPEAMFKIAQLLKLDVTYEELCE